MWRRPVAGFNLIHAVAPLCAANAVGWREYWVGVFRVQEEGDCAYTAKVRGIAIVPAVELRWGLRGHGPPERPGGPRETSVLRGFKGACKRPPWNCKMITHQSVIATCHSTRSAGVVVFRQMISSDDQTRNHFFVILCAGLQLHMLTKSRLLCN